MRKPNVTRGDGFLETFLAEKRVRMTDSLISEEDRSGRLLDIGCGTYPLFLLNTRFSEKFGLEKTTLNADESTLIESGININNFDIELNDELPFEDCYFDVVTMLAVFEHIDPKRLPVILNEIHRVLKLGGKYILTTPAPWTDMILRLMAAAGLVSKKEIEEHKDSYSKKKIRAILKETDFGSLASVTFGYFEIFMNLWAVIKKEA